MIETYIEFIEYYYQAIKANSHQYGSEVTDVYEVRYHNRREGDQGMNKGGSRQMMEGRDSTADCMESWIRKEGQGIQNKKEFLYTKDLPVYMLTSEYR